MLASSESFQVFADPRATPYYKGQCFVAAKIEKGRGANLAPISNECSPLVEAAWCLLQDPSPTDELAASILSNRYRARTIPSFYEWTGVGAESTVLTQLSAASIPLPWVDRDLSEQIRTSQRNAQVESRRYGTPLALQDFWLPGGRANEDGILIEVERLKAIIKYLKNVHEESLPHYSDCVEGYALIRSNSHDPGWRWCVKAGNHRAAVFAAMGIEVILVKIVSIVRDEDVSQWPGVKREYFTPAEALQIFDCIFDGRLRPYSGVAK